MRTPDISRRSLIAGATSAALVVSPLVAVAGAASVPEHDPLLDLIRACRAGNEAYNALEDQGDSNDDAVALTYGPAYEALSDAPTATSRAGALEALWFVREELEGSQLDAAPAVIAAALAYFEGEAA